MVSIRDLPDNLDRLREFNDGTPTTWGWFNKKTAQWKIIKRTDKLNIYCSVNPRNRVAARSLFADLDHCSINESRHRIQAAGLPKPTITVNSGHGVQAFWRLNQLLDDFAQWTALQKRLIQALDSDPAVHDPARLGRLPGFVNQNGEPAVAQIVDADRNLRYDLQELVLPPLQTISKKINGHNGHGAARDLIVKRADAYAEKFPGPIPVKGIARYFDYLPPWSKVSI